MRNSPFDWFCIAALILIGLIVAMATRAECEWCYADACYTSDQCGPGCSCITVGSDPVGTCIGGLD